MPLPDGLALLSRGIGTIENLFGVQAFTIEGQAAPAAGTWTKLDESEDIELAGKRVRLTETVEVRRELVTIELRNGLRVTRTADGAVRRIVLIDVDELTYLLTLGTVNR